MEKLISYICGDVTMLKHDMCVTAKNFKKQNYINRTFALLAVAGGVYIYANEVLREKNYKTLKSLKKEIEELKKSKGE